MTDYWLANVLDMKIAFIDVLIDMEMLLYLGKVNQNNHGPFIAFGCGDRYVWLGWDAIISDILL